MRSALLEIAGVTRVQVSLQEATALVTYDARVTSVDAFIQVINATEGPMGPNQYDASVKEAPRPARSSR